MKLVGWTNTYNPNTQATPNGGSLPTSFDIKLPQSKATSDVLRFDFDIPTFKSTLGYRRDTNSNVVERLPTFNHSGYWIFDSSADAADALDIITTYKGLGGTLVAEELDSAGSLYSFNPTAILKSCVATRKSENDGEQWLVSARFSFYIENSTWTTNVPPPTGGWPD